MKGFEPIELDRRHLCMFDAPAYNVKATMVLNVATGEQRNVEASIRTN